MNRLSAIVFVAAAAVAVVVVAVFASGGQRSRGGVETKMVGAAGVGAATAAKRAPVLVELFTSEGCSSCPPADAVLARLEEKQPVEGAEVISLAFHVDYWNHLGWSDPFSSRQFSERQGEYARAYGKEGVYTPQMIVDGVVEFPGGSEGRAQRAVGEAARASKGSVRITRADAPKGADAVRLSVEIEDLPAPASGDAADVLLAVTESGLSTEVARGENRGRRLSHVGVVRRLTAVGAVAPAPGGSFKAEAEVPVEKGWKRDRLRAVVFAQERGSRRVLAAGSVKLF